MVKKFCLFLGCLALVACQVPYPSNDARAYLKSRNGQPLVIPAPLKQDEISSFYLLPDACGNKRVSIHP